MIKIIIADDQELIRQSLQIILGMEKDIEVVDAVENGRQVIRSIRKNKPDVILMDIRMPEMDGVVCTQIIKDGASGYLLKGTSTKELADAIRKVYQGTAMINGDIASKVVKLFSRMAQTNLTIQVDEQQTASLKPTEKQIVALVGRVMSNKEIAGKLSLSEGTVRNSLSIILSKLALRDRTQLAIWAVQTGAANMEYEDDA